MKHYLLLIIFTVISVTANAEDDIYDKIRSRTCLKLCQLNDCLTFIADKNSDLETRQYYKKQALNMFVGKGYCYENDGVLKNGVKINIHSKYKVRNRSIYLRSYLNGLLNFTYKKVLIQLPAKVSGIQKIDDKHYVCYCYYDQIYIDQNDSVYVINQNDSIHTCKDFYTHKKVKCYIEVENTEDGYEYTILLGDIYAIETKSNSKL